MKTVAILFARQDSNYKMLPGCDVWDADRDARLWPGGCPVVAHPPCRAWGRLRHFARQRPDEKDLGLWAADQVRKWGGVLEHPSGSTLWDAAGLPKPGKRDKWGGWTLAAPQKWWGHKAEKATWFYVVGCAPGDVPAIPYVMGDAAYVVQSRKRSDYRPHITKAEREHTPPELAEWLVDLARRCMISNTKQTPIQAYNTARLPSQALTETPPTSQRWRASTMRPSRQSTTPGISSNQPPAISRQGGGHNA